MISMEYRSTITNILVSPYFSVIQSKRPLPNLWALHNTKQKNSLLM